VEIRVSFAASEHHDLLDVEESLYDQALAAIDCGDRDTAVRLLRRCAETGTGESAWLLAQLLEDAGDIQEDMTWYRRARAEGDPGQERNGSFAAPGDGRSRSLTCSITRRATRPRLASRTPRLCSSARTSRSPGRAPA
jgi:hypothetical protein